MSTPKESSRYGGQDISLAALIKVHYFPYLEHSNIPSLGEGDTQAEKSGYRPNRFLHQYTRKEVLRHAGQRFDNIFQDKTKEAINKDLFRIFIMGNSLAYGFGIPPKEKYFYLLEQQLRKNHDVHVIPAAVSAINSTQENILFHMSVLPERPDGMVFLDGWNDVMMPVIFSLRPGDPMIMSSLLRKYDQILFNMLIRACRWSKFLSLFVSKWIKKDRLDFITRFRVDHNFRESLSQSIVNVYMSNLQTMAEGCLHRKIPFLHTLQPSGDEVFERFGAQFSIQEREAFQQRMSDYPWADLKLGSFIAEIYARIRTEISKTTWAHCSVDLAPGFSLSDFSDPVHLNAQGQIILAQQLQQLLTPHLETQKEAS